MHPSSVPDDVAEHNPKHFFEGVIAAVVDVCAVLGIRSAPLAELLAIFDQCLDNHGQVISTRFRHRAPLVDLFLPDDMLGVGAEHGRDVDQVPCTRAFDCWIAHLGERV